MFIPTSGSSTCCSASRTASSSGIVDMAGVVGGRDQPSCRTNGSRCDGREPDLVQEAQQAEVVRRETRLDALDAQRAEVGEQLRQQRAADAAMRRIPDRRRWCRSPPPVRCGRNRRGRREPSRNRRRRRPSARSATRGSPSRPSSRRAGGRCSRGDRCRRCRGRCARCRRYPGGSSAGCRAVSRARRSKSLPSVAPKLTSLAGPSPPAWRPARRAAGTYSPPPTAQSTTWFGASTKPSRRASPACGGRSTPPGCARRARRADAAQLRQRVEQRVPDAAALRVAAHTDHLEPQVAARCGRTRLRSRAPGCSRRAVRVVAAANCACELGIAQRGGEPALDVGAPRSGPRWPRRWRRRRRDRCAPTRGWRSWVAAVSWVVVLRCGVRGSAGRVREGERRGRSRRRAGRRASAAAPSFLSGCARPAARPARARCAATRPSPRSSSVPAAAARASGSSSPATARIDACSSASRLGHVAVTGLVQCAGRARVSSKSKWRSTSCSRCRPSAPTRRARSASVASRRRRAPERLLDASEQVEIGAVLFVERLAHLSLKAHVARLPLWYSSGLRYRCAAQRTH